MEQDSKTTRGKLSIQYIAGYIDADGCISISKVRNRYNKGFPSYYLRVSVMGIDKAIVEDLRKIYGGTVHSKMSKHGHSCYLPHHRVQWRWDIVGCMAKRFLKEVVPYLRYKKEEGQTGIDFQTRKENYWEGGHNRGKPVPLEEVTGREQLWQKMRALKKRGETLETYRSRRD